MASEHVMHHPECKLNPSDGLWGPPRRCGLQPPTPLSYHPPCLCSNQPGPLAVPSSQTHFVLKPKCTRSSGWADPPQRLSHASPSLVGRPALTALGQITGFLHSRSPRPGLSSKALAFRHTTFLSHHVPSLGHVSPPPPLEFQLREVRGLGFDIHVFHPPGQNTPDPAQVLKNIWWKNEWTNEQTRKSVLITCLHSIVTHTWNSHRGSAAH